MAAWKLAPALCAGCCVVLKVSQYTPLTALRLGELALEAGVPPGVFNILTGKGSEIGDAITGHPNIDKVAFTGSTSVGKRIMAGAAGGIKPVTLELGGNSPIVVAPDCDMDLAVKGCHEALFFNTVREECFAVHNYGSKAMASATRWTKAYKILYSWVSFHVDEFQC